ncbi:MAG: HAMP domain-containing sensor histidine kinase [Actinomycetota bacterium]|nr:HAMP domain-containing sensor histidine kinase [Actinomycetota bacterium]
MSARSSIARRTRSAVLAAAGLALLVAFAGLFFAWQSYTVSLRTQELSRQVGAVASGIKAAGGVTAESDELREQLFRVQAGLIGAALFAADEGGTVLRSSASESNLVGEQIPLQTLGDPDERGIISGTRTGDAGRVLVVAAPAGDGWVVAAQPLREIVTAQRAVPYALAAALALAIAVAFVAGSLLARRITRPLVTLQGGAEAIAAGEWGRQVAVEGDDEVARVAEAFNHMSAQVADAYGAQKAFVGDVSHELRTPITSIRGWAGALLDGTVTEPEAVERSLRVIAEEADRLRTLTDSLLSLANLDAGVVELACERVSVAGLLEALQVRHGSRAGEAGLELEVAPGPGEPLADPERLLQAASVLVGNALAYTPAGGTVRVSAHVLADSTPPVWRLAVEDSGPGVPADRREEVFGRFVRLDASRSSHSGGSGLGLAICRRLVELMDGRVWVEDGSLGGARFVIELPA